MEYVLSVKFSSSEDFYSVVGCVVFFFFNKKKHLSGRLRCTCFKISPVKITPRTRSPRILEFNARWYMSVCAKLVKKQRQLCIKIVY